MTLPARTNDVSIRRSVRDDASQRIATLALAAGYSNLLAVVAGTTCGMLVANAPVVFLGNVFAGRLPMRAIHYTTTLLLLVIGAVFIIRAVGHWS
jgi:Ca2+/H+ antiporter, TMEM165/GDT1 family